MDSTENATPSLPHPKTSNRKRGPFFHLAAGRHVLGGKHGRVRRRLVAVSLNLHPAGYANHCFPSRQVRDVL